MKDLFEGLKRAKARTILSAVIIMLMSALICFSAFMMSPVRMGGGRQNFEKPDSQTVETTAENTSTENETENQEFDKSKIPERGNSTVFIIIIAASAVAGCALLVLINIKSSSKRKDEFASMMNNGVAVKSIKKQLALEAIAVAVVFGIIGSAVGIVVGGPVSNKVTASRFGDFQNMTDFDGEKPDFSEGFDKDSLPEDFDKDNLPEGFSAGGFPGGFDMSDLPEDFDPSNMPQGERPQMPNGGSFSRGNSEESETKTDNAKDFGGNSKTGYITSAVSGVIATVLFTASSAIGVTVPVKKKED